MNFKPTPIKVVISFFTACAIYFYNINTVVCFDTCKHYTRPTFQVLAFAAAAFIVIYGIYSVLQKSLKLPSVSKRIVMTFAFLFLGSLLVVGSEIIMEFLAYY